MRLRETSMPRWYYMIVIWRDDAASRSRVQKMVWSREAGRGWWNWSSAPVEMMKLVEMMKPVKMIKPVEMMKPVYVEATTSNVTNNNTFSISFYIMIDTDIIIDIINISFMHWMCSPYLTDDIRSATRYTGYQNLWMELSRKTQRDLQGGNLLCTYLTATAHILVRGGTWWHVVVPETPKIFNSKNIYRI